MSVITLRNLAYVLPDGRPLLSGLNESFGEGEGEGEGTGERKFTALVGRNGVGKTVLAKLMAGLLSPSSGSVAREGRVFYLDQLIDPARFSTVAGLMGLEEVLNAARRAEAGRADENDMRLADGNWDIEERLVRELRAAGLAHLTPGAPASALSGGECTRASLAGAFLSGADFLILDEPTNHLDAPSRRALLEYLQTWKKGLLAVSHDRELLERADRIVELSPQGLKSYGGGYSLYRERKALEQAAGESRLERARTERKRAISELQASVERQEHRAAQGRKNAAARDMPRALLHSMRQSAEKTAGKRRETRDEKLTKLARAEKEAFLSLDAGDPVVLIPPACSVHAFKIVLTMEALVLPYGSHRGAIDWTLTGPERVAVEGPNGSGKTTLLRVLTGELAPLSGSCGIRVPYSSLGQFSALPPERSSLELLLENAGGTLSSGEAGTRLAQIGVARERLTLPSGALSGGERLKAALLCALHRSPSPQLLILDEPTNHLDLDSVEAVEKVLNAYTGALLVVSHDAFFLDRVGASRRLRLE